VTFDPTPAVGAQPLEATTGTFVYLRDIVEALSQRWNRYVVGYDLRTQVHLFEDIGKRYDSVRASAGLDKGALDKVTRAPVLTTLLLVLSLVGYTFWKRRRRVVKVESSAGPRTPLEKRLETAAALYRGLEGALSLQGIPRPAALPPLRHAEQLRDGKHPLGDEVFALTNLYIETRFGGLELTTERARDFERRVREIKVTKAVKNAAVASASAT
jgi:hypothetical protein